MIAVKLLPSVEINCAGEPLPPPLSDALDSIVIQQLLSQPACCVLSFSLAIAADFSCPGVGDELEVVVAGRRLFVGDVTAQTSEYKVDRELVLLVRAYDRLHRLRKNRRIAAYVQQDCADVAATMAAIMDTGVEVIARGPVFEQVMQHGQTDLELLQALAARSALYFYQHEQVLFLDGPMSQGQAVELEMGENLISATFEKNADSVCRQVLVTGWDPHSAHDFQSEATRAGRGRHIGDDMDPAVVHSDGRAYIADQAMQSDEQGMALAQAWLDAKTAMEFTVEGIADGNPDLRVGCSVEIQGVEAGFEGSYKVMQVCHRIDMQQAYVTEFSTRPPLDDHGVAQRAAVATHATVSDINDPEQWGRVKVTLNNLEDLETGWLQVLAAGAGAGKGVMFMPDVGDLVLVLAVNGDYSQAVVLGGMYGSESPPELGIQGGNTSRFSFVSPRGQQFCIDDDASSVTVRNRDGSSLSLTPDVCTLSARSRLVLEAPGNQIIIRGNRIDFKKQ